MTVVISLQGVSFHYSEAAVLEQVDLTIEAGEFLGIVGPNGGGKSTLLKLILGLLEPSCGDITVLGTNPQQARQRIGYVPQFAGFRRDFPITVQDTVLLGRLGQTRWLGGYSAEDHRITAAMMQRMQIEGFARRPIAALSGGELQRVLIARALVAEPEILILDEPTANIDMRGEQDIFDLLKEVHEDKTLIVVSHDIGFISGYVDRVACLSRTLMCHSTAELSGDDIQRLYDGPVRMIQHSHHHGEPH